MPSTLTETKADMTGTDTHSTDLLHTAAKQWAYRYIVDLESLSAEQIRTLLRVADDFRDASTRSGAKSSLLRGRVVANLFFEDSTRTRSSFELAAQRLSADVINLTGKGSSVSKGETIVDTARNIEAMGVDAIVVRHGASGSARLIAESVRCAVLNAGDGSHEHPTQGLLDTHTLARALDRLDYDLAGLTVGIVGDNLNSRVARSNIHALTKLGAKVICIGPPTLVPSGFRALGVELSHDLDAVLPRLDAINMLRIQFERMSEAPFPSVREYTHFFGLSEERAAKMKPGAIVMHPGPINRGVELAAAVADGDRSVILKQVTSGLAVRMAALYLCVSAITK
ncbi:MAG: aspartate carbamoyltransferase catalytic subunit [Phycisphaerales bacterium]|nr:aspartate carbamoyltransferase catalytic subunit [Phycisphaerales bacterium]